MDDSSQGRAFERYFSLREEMPQLFSCAGEGGIDILTDPADIAAAQMAARRARESRGLDTSDLRVGLLARDPHMLVLRDAVRFPDGSLGLYNRIVEFEGVAILPLMENRPVLLRIFRHALRDWSLEFPRGGCERGEMPEMTARRELKEEIGANILELIPLGRFSPGASTLSFQAHFFAARVDRIGTPDRADGIADIRVVQVVEIEELMRTSRIIDGFTLSLFLRARLTGLI